MGDSFSFDIDNFVSNYVQNHGWFDDGDGSGEVISNAAPTTLPPDVTSNGPLSISSNASTEVAAETVPAQPVPQPPGPRSWTGAPSNTGKPYCVGCARTDIPLCKAADQAAHEAFLGSLPHNAEYNHVRRHSAYDKKLVWFMKPNFKMQCTLSLSSSSFCRPFTFFSGLADFIPVLRPLPGIQLLLYDKCPDCSFRLAGTCC